FGLLHEMSGQVLPLPTTQADLGYFVGLEVVLEMNPCIQRSIMLVCLVLEVDLSKSQTHAFRRRLVIGAAMDNTRNYNVVHLDDEEFLLRPTCFPMGDCRFLQVGTRGTCFHEQRRRFVDMVNDREVLEGRLPHATSATRNHGTRVRHSP